MFIRCIILYSATMYSLNPYTRTYIYGQCHVHVLRLYIVAEFSRKSFGYFLRSYICVSFISNLSVVSMQFDILIIIHFTLIVQQSNKQKKREKNFLSYIKKKYKQQSCNFFPKFRSNLKYAHLL